MSEIDYDNLIQIDISRVANPTNQVRSFNFNLAPNTCYVFKDAFAQKQIEALCNKIEELEEEIEKLKANKI